MLQLWRSILIFFSCCLTLEAFGGYLSFSPRSFQASAALDTFMSTSNYAGSGSSEKLPDGNDYSLMNLDMKGRYVLNPSWAVYGGAVYSQAQSKTGVLKRNNTSLNKLGVGVQYFTFMNGLEIVPEVSLLNSLDAPSTDSDFVPNNEGVMELIGLTHIQKMFHKYSLFGHSGINFRGSGRSTLFLWGGGAEGYSGSLTYGAEILGFLSLITDKDANKQNSGGDDRTAYLNRVAGGSKKFYSYDPSLVDLNLYSFYNITRAIALGLDLGTTLMGTNMASGFHGGIHFILNFDFSDSRDVYPSATSEKGVSLRKSRKGTPGSASQNQKKEGFLRFRPAGSGAQPQSRSNQQGQRDDLAPSVGSQNPRANSYRQFQEDLDPASSQKLSTDEGLENFQGEAESTIDPTLFQGESAPAEDSAPAPGSVRRMNPSEGPVSRRELYPETNRKKQSRPSIYDPPAEEATRPSYRKPDPLRDVKDPRIVPSNEIPNERFSAPRKTRSRTANEKFEYSNRPLPQTAPSNKRIRTRSKTRTEIPAFNDDAEMRKQLDATEMQIELKQAPKKKKKKTNR